MLPKTKDNYLGIEVELCSPYPYSIVYYIAEKLGYKIDTNLSIGYDSSVVNIYEDKQEKYLEYDHYPSDNGFELRFLIKQKDILKETKRMAAFFKQIKAKVTKDCGLHVHLDARNVDRDVMINNLINNQYQIVAASPQSRLKPTGFCYPRETTLDDIRDGRLEKYSAINFYPLRRLNTIEVRTHEGCVDAKEIYRWCRFLMDIAYKGVLDNESEQYITKRYAI